jgi:hypothetical protein
MVLSCFGHLTLRWVGVTDAAFSQSPFCFMQSESMATFLSCWDHADIRLEGLKGQRKSNEGATISARKAGGRATVLCCRRQVKLCAPKSRSGRAKSSAKSRGYLCFADRFLCAPQTASPHASALQLVSLFCTDLQRSLIIGHIIKTPQSRCMYHWDGPLDRCIVVWPPQQHPGQSPFRRAQPDSPGVPLASGHAGRAGQQPHSWKEKNHSARSWAFGIYGLLKRSSTDRSQLPGRWWRRIT